MQKYHVYIDGKDVDSSSGKYAQAKSVRINTGVTTGNPFVMR